MSTRRDVMKDRRDIGQVVFLHEKMAAAQRLNSSCIGVEASLETNKGFEGLYRELRSLDKRGGSDDK